MATRLKLVSSDAASRDKLSGDAAPASGQTAVDSQKRFVQTLQLVGLAVMVLGFGGRLFLPGVTVFPLLGIAGWAFFGGATATSRRILQVVSTVLVLAIAGLLYVLLPEAPGVSISLLLGYIGGLVGAALPRRSTGA